ncbi:MAG: flagellin FliC3 [Lachnospiraceae bacterium]|nr:flagellin FliC3 [Lachnospiraceae bacterium]
MRINYNASAVITNKALNQSDSLLSQSMQRLSSGLKINKAQDNPAGLAISNRMDSQVKGLGVAKNNSNDGISVIETAEGALAEIHSILQRMNELAVQAGTDSNTDEDRELIQKEIYQLQDEVERIARDTEFNGMPLLDGSFDLKGYTDDPKVKVDHYTADVPANKYVINDLAALYSQCKSGGEVDLDESNSEKFEGKGCTARLADDGKLIIKGTGDFEIRLDFEEETPSASRVELDITGMGAMTIQTGANEGQEVDIQIPAVSLKKMGIEKSNGDGTPVRNEMKVSDFESAQKAITQVKGAIDYISDIRSKLGAYQNRMEHNVTSLDVSSENLTAAYSRLADVDMAEEMTEYSTQQVLVQAGLSMLAQANERPQQVLQLLQ